MPVISRQGMTANLQIGAGPQFLGVSSAGSNAPNINHLCLGVDDFNVDRITAVLSQRGITRSDAAGNAGGGGLGGGPMRMRVRMRGPEAGGAKEGTPGAVLQRSRWRRDPAAGSAVLRRRRRSRQRVPAARTVAEKGLLALARLEPLHDLRIRRRACEQLLSGSLRPARSGVSGPDRSGAGRRRRPVPDVRRRRRPRSRERRARGRQHPPPLHEHGRVQHRRGDQGARELRHQAKRQRSRPRGTAGPLHQHAHGESRRRQGRHAGALLHRSGRTTHSTAGLEILRRRRAFSATFAYKRFAQHSGNRDRRALWKP